MSNKRSCVIDIESNNFTENLLDFSSFPYKFGDEARLWCVVIRDLDTGEEWSAELEQVTKEWMEEKLSPFYYIIAHNGIKFDLPQLMLFGVLDYKIGYIDQSDTCFGRECKWLDSLILSRLANPDRGGHSLAAWGRRVGEFKDDYRQQCIEAGYIEATDPTGEEFKEYNPLMLPYCKQDCKTNAKVFKAIMEEFRDHNWGDSIQMEHKLADLAIRRELLGFDFDKDLALKCLDELNDKLDELADKVEPLIPPKPLNKTELNFWTPPKTQRKKNGDLSAHMINFLSRIGATCKDDGFVFEDKFYPIPYEKGALKEEVPAEMKDFDHIKMYLISLGWDPIEWSERDMTKDSKKKNLSFEKRVAVLDRWWKDTTNGKYEKHRIEGVIEANRMATTSSYEEVYEKLKEKLHEKWPVRVYTSPKIRVGIEKELCPNLVKLGEKVSFARDFADWLTYRHRRNAIAGGVMDEDTGVPSSGFLSAYREEDGRIGTPSIEIGASTGRYTHKTVANIPRASSIYGKEMRSLFRAGDNAVFFGFDYSSLENRIQGSYIYKYDGGPEMAESLVAEKPNDSHCFSEDTEILTLEGWKSFENITTENKVAQWEQNGNISFVNPNEVVWENYEGDMIETENNNISQLVTPNHRVLTMKKNSGTYSVVEAKNLKNIKSSNTRIPLAGKLIATQGHLDNNLIKLIVATQADGHLCKDSSAIQFSFVKKNKVKRLSSLLDNFDIEYLVKSYKRKNREEFTIRIPASNLSIIIRNWLSKNKEFSYDILRLSESNRIKFINELAYWDGTKTKSNIIYDVTCKTSSDVVQAVCHTLNIKCTRTTFNKKTDWGEHILQRCTISLKTKPWAGLLTTKEGIVKYKGKIGCVSVPSGFILVRRKGRAFISGNTLNSIKLGIPRVEVKSFTYAVLYGAAAAKIKKMLGISLNEAKKLIDDFWNSNPALNSLKKNLEKYWETTDKKFVLGIDRRKIRTRSKHSLLNALFQSGGVIFAKYVSVYLMQKMEEQGLCIDPFVGKPDICSMIEYHDEQDMYASPGMFKFQLFDTEEQAKEFSKNWTGNQLSAVAKGKEKYFVALPSPVSIGIEESIEIVKNRLNISVDMGFEYMIGNNWFECH